MSNKKMEINCVQAANYKGGQVDVHTQEYFGGAVVIQRENQEEHYPLYCCTAGSKK